MRRVGQARQTPPKTAMAKRALYQTNPSGFRDTKKAPIDSTANHSAPYVADPPRRKSCTWRPLTCLPIYSTPYSKNLRRRSPERWQCGPTVERRRPVPPCSQSRRDASCRSLRPRQQPRPGDALETSGGRRRGEGIHLHHRRRSIHVSPASETRTSKRLRPGPSWRSGVIQTMRASTKRTTRARGVFLRHPADGLLGDPEPDLAAVGVELGPEPEGSVRFQGGVPRRQGPRPAGPVLAPPLDDDHSSPPVMP